MWNDGVRASNLYVTDKAGWNICASRTKSNFHNRACHKWSPHIRILTRRFMHIRASCNFSRCVLDKIFRSQNSVASSTLHCSLLRSDILIKNKGYINMHSIEIPEILRRINMYVCVYTYTYIYFACCSLTFYLKSIFVDFLFLRHLVAERWWFNTSKVKWKTWSVKNSIGGEIQQF